jgi:hypothetical protein
MACRPVWTSRNSYSWASYHLYRKRPPRIVNRTVPKIIAISVHTVNRFPLIHLYVNNVTLYWHHCCHSDKYSIKLTIVDMFCSNWTFHHISQSQAACSMIRNRDYFGDGSVHDTWRPLTIQMIWCSFFEKNSVELLLSSFGDHLINILRKHLSISSCMFNDHEKLLWEIHSCNTNQL